MPGGAGQTPKDRREEVALRKPEGRVAPFPQRIAGPVGLIRCAGLFPG